LEEPYYLKIKDPQEFLRHYLNIYEGEYNKTRAQKIISLFPPLRDKRVLDIGCGGGFYSLATHRKNCKDIALVDISSVCVKAAKLNLLENADADSEGVVADVTNLPLRKECLDFILCIDLIEHVQKDDELLHEIRRVLKDNGLMLVATQNSNSINYILEAPIQRYVLKNHSWMGWDPTHVRFYNSKWLCQLLRNSGFSYVKIAGTYFMPYSLALWLRRVHKRISEIAYHILMMLNERLEQKRKAFWNLFGWGIMCLCVKSKDR
jgi:2-polyprenyl-6-hydroxyphenyl methylase/3-demethylubiquinone-9 3-methyltransferase